MRAGVADTHAATEVAKLYNAAYTYQQLDAETATATLNQLKALWQKAQSDTYNEYTNQAPLIGWALANVYLINHDEQNALHTLDKLIELTAPQSLIQTKAVELRHKIIHKETKKELVKVFKNLIYLFWRQTSANIGKHWQTSTWYNIICKQAACYHNIIVILPIH